MKTITCLLIALKLVSHPCLAESAQKELTEDIAVSNIEATEVYQTLKPEYPEIAEIVRKIEITKNSLTINPCHPKADSFKKSLALLDRRPAQIFLKAVITEVTKSTGQEKVLSRPSLFTLDGQPSIFTLPTSSEDKELKITITPRSLPTVAKK